MKNEGRLSLTETPFIFHSIPGYNRRKLHMFRVCASPSLCERRPIPTCTGNALGPTQSENAGSTCGTGGGRCV